jgi:hypothetical protein
MPLPVLTVEESAAMMETSASDLRYRLTDLGVPDNIQVAFYHGGFATMGIFATLDRTEEGVRAFLMAEFGLGAAASIATRRLIAVIINAWEAAKDQKLNAEERLTSTAKSGRE